MSALDGEVPEALIENIRGKAPGSANEYWQNAGVVVQVSSRQFSSNIDKARASDLMLCVIDNDRPSGKIEMWSTSLGDPELQQKESERPRKL